jgi:hypothetical protein
VNGEPISTAERWRRYQRDLVAYRQRSLWRRSHARFRADLNVIPRVFLLAGKARIARLETSRETVLDALRGRVVWTLDTAARLVGMKGFITAADLTGYMTEETLRQAEQAGWITTPQEAGLSLEPLYQRPLSLIAHLVDALPPSIPLPSGHLVVSWDDLQRDLLGTLGWRPDLLTRLERDYPGKTPSAHPG